VLAACGCPDPDSPFRLVARGFAGAALRAAADQVAPEHYSCYTGHGEFDFGMDARNEAIREDLLAIAAELEGFE
jgi:hypothetical protein